MNSATDRHGRRRATPARPEGGFTILETVIALFVAMVVGFGAISLFLFSTSFNAGASDRARALALAQERMEAHRATPYADFPSAATTTNEEVNLGSNAAGVSDRRTFRVQTQIQDDADVPDSKQKIITVTVTPKEIGGRWTAGGVTLVMLRASDEVGNN